MRYFSHSCLFCWFCRMRCYPSACSCRLPRHWEFCALLGNTSISFRFPNECRADWKKYIAAWWEVLAVRFPPPHWRRHFCCIILDICLSFRFFPIYWLWASGWISHSLWYGVHSGRLSEMRLSASNEHLHGSSSGCTKEIIQCTKLSISHSCRALGIGDQAEASRSRWLQVGVWSLLQTKWNLVYPFKRTA